VEIDPDRRIEMNTESKVERRVTASLITAVAMSVGLIGGFGLASVHASSRAGAAIVAPAPVAAVPVALPDFAKIVADRGGAVVNVSVSGFTKTDKLDTEDGPWAPQWRGRPGDDQSDPFYEFFKRFRIPDNGHGGPRAAPMHGQGSGFIVSPDGVILTNAHVVRGADRVTVKLTDRRELQAKVLGSDPKTDVAVLKVDAKNLPTVPLGSARDLAVGQWVVAIGSPFGFENTVTAGIVSAKGRSLPGDGFVPFIQTDVPVNPGNSGGPLLNTRGEVVGINSQIYSGSGGYQGISFAIPIDLALSVKEQIVRTGHVLHARLGVLVQDVNQAFADSFKLDRPEGALVSHVESNSAAERAGLKAGDVIRAIDGQRIVAAGDLSSIVGQAAPGTAVSLEVWHQGKSEHLKATLGNIDDKATESAAAGDAAGHGRLGLALRPLQPQERRDAGVNGGLMVEDAVGAAALAGVQAGDVLVAVNGTPVKTIAQVRDIVGTAKKSVALLVEREGTQIFLPVQLG
jgi:serine protease Do